MKRNVKIFLTCLTLLIFILLSLTGCSTETTEIQDNSSLENSVIVSANDSSNLEEQTKEEENQAQKEAEEQAKKEAEAQAQREAEEQARKAAEAQAQKEAEEQAKKVSEAQKQKQTSSKVTVPASETGDNLVWVPTNGGKKYHSRSGCSNMKNPNQVTKATAEANGFTPCKKCY